VAVRRRESEFDLSGDEKMKTEGIEAVIYPGEDTFTAMGKKRGKEYTVEEVKEKLQQIVNEVNHGLLPYKRISRLQVVNEPMEMTTTKKIKRHKVSGE